MVVQLVDQGLNFLAEQELAETPHEFRLDILNGMVSVQEADQEKSRNGDKDHLAGKVEGIPETNYFLPRDLGGKSVDISKLRAVFPGFQFAFSGFEISPAPAKKPG